ncbi:MAG: transcriptional repressor [Desulfobacterales bacterium]|nr:transcriptional repressor [Desulfobacterales bacterium]
MGRITIQKTAIEKVFRQHERPLGIDEVLKYGRKLVASLNQATVYRNLKTLIDDGWLKRISHPILGSLYERTGKGHHHHFYCRGCNRTFDISGCALKEEHTAPDGFIVEDHELFLFGVCPSCVEKTT